MNLQDKIRHYLLRQLDEPEMAAFKQEILSQPALAEKVRNMKLLMMVETLEDEQTIRSWIEPPTAAPARHRSKWYWMVGVAVLLCGLAVWYRYSASTAVLVPSPPPVLPEATPPPKPPDTIKTIEPAIALPPATRPKPVPLTLTDRDLAWLKHQNQKSNSASAFAVGDTLAVISHLVENKEFAEAIAFGQAIFYKDDEIRLNLCFALFGTGKSREALRILQTMQRDGITFFETRNGANLIAAKCHYQVGNLEKCRQTIALIKQERAGDPDSQKMGLLFWEEVKTLEKTLQFLK